MHRAAIPGRRERVQIQVERPGFEFKCRGARLDFAADPDPAQDLVDGRPGLHQSPLEGH